MGLTAYSRKRKFDDTPEPSGKKKAALAQNLQFVVQKHDATRLHYDFRVEVDGVLKSWAIPKGPSMNPEDKRLAVHVEDHPFDYKDFEGNIPAGNYGAGNVIVWDNGNYMPENGTGSKKEDEKLMRKGIREGKLDLILNGQKLKGAFVFVKPKGPDKNAWLLIKKSDEYAKTTDVLKKSKSVISGKTVEKISTPVKKTGSAKKKKTASKKKS